MRVLIFHGYLLRGTGSNVYNASLAEALAGLGHEVALVCQERAPESLGFVGAAGDWDGGELAVRSLGDGGVTVFRPDIGGVLPVYVADRYEGLEARPFSGLSDDEVEDYVARNVAAVREVAERLRPDVALANHLVMGPAVLARALGGTGIPYAVKIHGSALEYTVKPDPERFMPWAREGLAGAAGVLVGSRHTAESLWAAMDDPGLPGRTRLGPPGVDVARFAPRSPDEAAAGLVRLAETERARASAAQPPSDGDEESSFTVDHARAADALATLRPGHERLVAFTGKLIVSKGVDLLLAAWPLVAAEHRDAALVVVGFGGFRDALEEMADALRAGELDRVHAIARDGRAREGGDAAPLALLAAFLDGLAGDERERYLAAAAGMRIAFTGRLEHDQLADLLPACEAQVVPSTFPEAFGMVAAEAAACGALPVCAGHSGLAEVAGALAGEVPADAAWLLEFPVDEEVVRAIAARLGAWLGAPPPLRAATREALVRAARDRYSWEGVASGVIDAAQGRLGELPEVPAGG